ncbi:MAG: hypothetical protein ACLRSW_17225 [Christensenellaceae bacterium]
MEIESTKTLSIRAERTAVSGEKCRAAGITSNSIPKPESSNVPAAGRKEILTRAGEEIAFSSLVGQNGNWQNETHIYHCSNCNAEEVFRQAGNCPYLPFSAVRLRSSNGRR